jgi:4-amino-4-deoxychorismate lyase
MCQFIETICCEHGHFMRIEMHNERFNRTRYHFYGLKPYLQLELFLKIPDHLQDKTVKCRVVYGPEIISAEYDLYTIKPVRSLQLVCADSLDYSFKFSDRTKLASLYDLRGQSDDILIVKNGFITDTSCANIVFRKDNLWYSPEKPLLLGTRLEFYIRKGDVIPYPVRPRDLPVFSEARIINAMVSIENSTVIPVENIQNKNLSDLL